MSDPIGAVAVIGMAGRFPGAADVERFWENLRAGVHSITFFDAEEEEADPAHVRAAGVLEGVDLFRFTTVAALAEHLGGEVEGAGGAEAGAEGRRRRGRDRAAVRRGLAGQGAGASGGPTHNREDSGAIQWGPWR